MLFKSTLGALALAATAQAATTCNVLSYGGKADNSTDVGPAILSAYNNCVVAHKTTNPADTILLVPSGNFALKTNVEFPNAVSYFTFEIDGNINIPFNPALAGNLFWFQHCNFVNLAGSGTVFGNGGQYRPGGNLGTYPSRPRLFRFENCNNCDISGVTLNNSPMFHMTIIGNNNVVHDQKVVADTIGTTDGYDISGNNNYAHDLSVQNGDECVTVKTPTNGFRAERITCIGTAGCNIGSFGSGGAAAVENVSYDTVTLSNSDSGILIKSYPNSSGYVKNVTYTNIKMTNVAYPLEIEETWDCGSSCPGATHQLAVSDIHFSGVTGTGDSSTRPLITVDCAAGVKCTDITFSGVSLTKSGGAAVTYNIQNACGTGLSALPGC